MTNNQVENDSNKARTLKRYQKLHRLLTQWKRCDTVDNLEWRAKTGLSLHAIMRNTAPHGRGFDLGTNVIMPDDTAYKSEVLKFTTAFHHMHESGMYDGWTEHVVTVKPDLSFGFTLHISGRNRNDIKDHIHEVFEIWLNEVVAEFDE